MTRKPLPPWDATIVAPSAPIRDALVVMGRGRRQIALVVDDTGRLLGTVTDGDVRRAILDGIALERPARDIMHVNPSTISADTPRADQVERMRDNNIHHLPVVDVDGRVIGLVSLDELLVPVVVEKPNMAILLVGGLGSRLRPLTNEKPKPLIPVGGRPVLETIVGQLRDHGIRRLNFAVNHMADAIKAHFGGGERFGVSIEYLEEDEPLGTAGALGLIAEAPAEPIVVMNGDILTNVDFSGLLAHHAETGAAATVATRTYEIEVPFGVIENDGHTVTAIVEKPIRHFQVNAGIYVFEPGVQRRLPAGKRRDMPDLLSEMIADGEVVSGFPIHEYWIDIGRIEDLNKAAGEFGEVFGQSKSNS
jgi:dTDP-glucose pyrophosphorylase/CBS domain-containing protein